MNAKQEPKKEENDLQYDETERNETSDKDDDADTPESRITKLKEKLRECEKLQKEYLDGWQRAKADFINYKKDEIKRFEAITERALDDITHDILMVLDSFHLARQYEMPPKIAEGIVMIRGQLEDVLRKRGFVMIAVRAGDAFDPSMHESIGETESTHPAGTVAEEAQKGYKFNGRVLRPARVRLAKEKK